MILDSDKKFLFIAVAKTACTSIHRRFGLFRDPPPEEYHMFLKDALLKHPEALEYYKFGFVRNPYDRLVSAYYNFKHSIEHKEWAFPIYKYDTFKEFVLDLEESECFQFIHLRPQIEYLAIDGKIGVDFVGKYENLEQDFLVVENHLGLENKILSKERTSKHPPSSELYDEETREIVRRLYKDDFEKFGYEK
jgi:hypothetical protein